LFVSHLFVCLFVDLLLYVQYNLVWMNFGEIACVTLVLVWIRTTLDTISFWHSLFISWIQIQM